MTVALLLAGSSQQLNLTLATPGVTGAYNVSIALPSADSYTFGSALLTTVFGLINPFIPLLQLDSSQYVYIGDSSSLVVTAPPRLPSYRL